MKEKHWSPSLFGWQYELVADDNYYYRYWSPDFRIVVSYHKSIAGTLCSVSVSTDHNNFHREGFVSLDVIFKVIEEDIKNQLEELKVLTRIVQS